MAADAACAENGRKIARQPNSSLHPGDSPRSCSFYSSRALPLFAKRTPTVAGRGSRINQHSARTRHCSPGAARQFRSPWSQDVKHCFAGSNEVVGDNPSMAPPPHSLGTHDSTAPCVPGAPELLQTLPEFAAHRIISIIMKAFVHPETVHRPWDRTVLAQPSELRDMHIAEIERGQTCGEHVPIVLRIPARARNCADVCDKLYLGFLQQSDEIGDRTCRMSDGEERVCQRCLPRAI
jgi:hypothetical protein